MMNTFEALAEPTRRRILDLLRDQPRLVGEVADLLKISQPSASKHLRVLREVGLVRSQQEAQRHWYEVRFESLAEIDDWLAPYRQFMTERYDRLEELLDELQEEEKDAHDEA